MKYLFFLTIILSIFSSCKSDQSNCTLTKADSLEIFKKIAGTDSSYTSFLAKKSSQYNFTSKYNFTSTFEASPRTVIPFTTAKDLHKNYLNNPIASLVNSNQEMIRGFKIEAADFQRVTGVAGNGARIYLGRDNATDQYRLMLVAMDGDEANVVNAIVDDFFPCPNHCPIDNTGGTPAQRKKRFENDLNYNQTIGNEVEYMDFGGILKRIRYQ